MQCFHYSLNPRIMVFNETCSLETYFNEMKGSINPVEICTVSKLLLVSLVISSDGIGCHAN